MQTKLRSIQSPVLSFVSQKQLSDCHSNVRQRGQTLGEDDGREPHRNVFAWELGYFAVADKTKRARVTDGYLGHPLRRELAAMALPLARLVLPGFPACQCQPRPHLRFPKRHVSSAAPACSRAAFAACAAASAPAAPAPRRRRRRRSSKWARGHASSCRTSRGTPRPTKCARSSRTTAPSSASR